MELKWDTKFTASEVINNNKSSETNNNSNNINKLILKGVLINTDHNKNNWCIEEEDFQHLAKNFINKQLRMDHAEKLTSVLGIVKSTELDNPHDFDKFEWDPSTEFPHIHFQAELTSEDNNILIPIKMGYISHVSPAVDSLKILCSICKEPMKFNGYQHAKTCNCEGGIKLLKELTPRELSLVVSPAYAGTVVKSYGFAASVDNEFLSEDKILEIVQDELSKRGL